MELDCRTVVERRSNKSPARGWRCTDHLGRSKFRRTNILRPFRISSSLSRECFPEAWGIGLILKIVGMESELMKGSCTEVLLEK
jgi:hypothetical protein